MNRRSFYAAPPRLTQPNEMIFCVIPPAASLVVTMWELSSGNLLSPGMVKRAMMSSSPSVPCVGARLLQRGPHLDLFGGVAIHPHRGFRIPERLRVMFRQQRSEARGPSRAP